MRRFLFIAGCFSISTVFSQGTPLLTGYIKDNVSHLVIPFASITNMSTHKTVLSNKNGVFKIAVAANQLLSFASVGYNFDTLRCTEMILTNDTLPVFLSPFTRKLEDVTVTAQYSGYQLDSLQRRKDFFQTITEHTVPVASIANSGAGFGINLDHFYGPEKRKRKVIGLFEQMEQEQYINYRFPPLLVSQYTTLSEDSLSLFIQQYRPAYSWLRKHTSREDLVYYINDKLKLFFKRKDQ